MKLKRFISVAVVIMVLLSLMACGGKSQDQAQGQSGSAQPPAMSKTLNVAISENIITMDPHHANNLPGTMLTTFLYSFLVFSDHEGNYSPMLATEWTVNPEGTEITFKLRQGVKFVNGEDFNADDVVVSYQRLIDRKNELAFAIQYWTQLKAVEKIDDYTVKIIMAGPYAPFFSGCSQTAIIPNEAYAQYGDALFHDQKCYGTGPWQLIEWIDGQYFHVKKNPNYWDKSKYDPYFDEVYVRHVLEGSTAVAGHLSGDVDANLASGGINADLLPLYKGTENKIEIYTMDTGAYQYFGFQCREGSPFNDINVRKAFDAAIDRESIVKTVYGGGKVPASIIVDGTIGYDPSLVSYKYNPEEAKRLLAASGYKGQPIELSSHTSTLKAEEGLLAVSDMLNKVGFNTHVNVVENAVLGEMRATGRYDMYMVTVMHNDGDPTNILTLRVLTDTMSSNYKNPALNSLLDRSNKAMDKTERTKLLQDAGRIMYDEHAPHSPFVQLQALMPIIRA
jgi:peptide/nickel transport system substrate-binding protein/glutathione transport system substrate-binding protein